MLLALKTYHKRLAAFTSNTVTYVKASLLLVCLFFTGHINAQQVENKPAAAPTNNPTADTIAIWRLSFEADALRFKAPDSSLSLYQQALNQSTAAKYTNGIAYSLLGLATLFSDRGDLSQSIDVLRIARPYCETAAQKMATTWYG